MIVCQLPHAEEIRLEIDAETARHLKKTGRAISPEPIYLTVFSPNVPNLTLVDMPGLTKVPIDGQPASIVQDLEDMARNYVKHENAIILAVSPANADLATSDALRLARDVDPAGDRTIGVCVCVWCACMCACVALVNIGHCALGGCVGVDAPSSRGACALALHSHNGRCALATHGSSHPPNAGVITKIDIMDRGTDCRDVLQGQAMRLKHGWVAVVNRGQADLNSKVRRGGDGAHACVVHTAHSCNIVHTAHTCNIVHTAHSCNIVHTAHSCVIGRTAQHAT
jgi:hypothetical protein